jgi:shikimate kinase
MKIILVGFMACGKSLIGRQLSKKIGVPFYDTDEIIEKKLGKTVNEIFIAFGENHFREIEKQCIENLKLPENFVLSVGGGLPCFNNLIYELNNLGSTIFLKVDLEEIYQRLLSSKNNRPLLLNLEDNAIRSYLQELYDQRLNIYSNAQFTMDVTHMNVNETIEHLLKNVNLLPQKDQ